MENSQQEVDAGEPGCQPLFGPTVSHDMGSHLCHQAILSGNIGRMPHLCQNHLQAYCPSLRPFSNHMETAPWIQGRHCLIFMEDNAPILSCQWQQQNQLNKINWPSHSPDLNPIKNIWKLMEVMIAKLYQPQNVSELQQSIQATWDDVPQTTLDDLLLSMHQQMQMVIDQQGGPTS
ncbi:hypothetical protein O181_001531 [Austropuccinia psidii MF-1]|uniref:Tc1-like transposase DDE domain-containing protein n=1 Tax=Austropuccinia psidii MF-1 TaxID=1389203 RepID=A0A9Q3GCH6_9BASI|nr:hypothetical protein [Austropuccinia psidii MF-1]